MFEMSLKYFSLIKNFYDTIGIQLKVVYIAKMQAEYIENFNINKQLCLKVKMVFP